MRAHAVGRVDVDAALLQAVLQRRVAVVNRHGAGVGLREVLRLPGRGNGDVPARHGVGVLLHKRDEVGERQRELAEVVGHSLPDDVTLRSHGVALASAREGGAHNPVRRVVDGLEVLAAERVANVGPARLDDERTIEAAALVDGGEVVVVREDRPQLVVGVPALVDRLARHGHAVRLGVRVPGGGGRDTAAGVLAAHPGRVVLRLADGVVLHRIGCLCIEGDLVLGEGRFLVVPAVGRAVAGRHVELHQVDVLAEHVGLRQFEEVVVADEVRQHVRERVVDAVTRVDPHEQRLGLFGPSEDGRDVLGQHQHAALGVVVAPLVVDDVALQDGDVVAHLAGGRRAGVGVGRATRCGGTAVRGQRDRLLDVESRLRDRGAGDVAGRVDLGTRGGVALGDAAQRLRGAPAVLAGDHPWKAGARRAGQRQSWAGDCRVVAAERQQRAHVDPVRSGAQALLLRGAQVGPGRDRGAALLTLVVHPVERPEALREVRVEVAVEDDIAEGAVLAPAAEQQLGGVGLTGRETLRVDGVRLRHCGLAGLQVGHRADVAGLGEPLVGVQVEDMRLLDPGQAEADLHRVAVVGVEDVRDVAGLRQAAVLRAVRTLRARRAVLLRDPGTGPAGQLDQRGVAVGPRRQPGLLPAAVRAAVLLPVGQWLRAVVEAEPDAGDLVLRDLRALAERFRGRRGHDVGVDVQLAALRPGLGVAVDLRTRQAQLGAAAWVEPARAGGLDVERAERSEAHLAGVVLCTPGHAEVTEQVHAFLARRGP